VEVLPSGKGNRAFWSDHGKAFEVTCSGDREKKNNKEARLLRSQEHYIRKTSIEVRLWTAVTLVKEYDRRLLTEVYYLTIFRIQNSW
jgi:hypothetical protein